MSDLVSSTGSGISLDLVFARETEARRVIRCRCVSARREGEGVRANQKPSEGTAPHILSPFIILSHFIISILSTFIIFSHLVAFYHILSSISLTDCNQCPIAQPYYHSQFDHQNFNFCPTPLIISYADLITFIIIIKITI